MDVTWGEQVEELFTNYEESEARLELLKSAKNAIEYGGSKTNVTEILGICSNGTFGPAMEGCVGITFEQKLDNMIMDNEAIAMEGFMSFLRGIKEGFVSFFSSYKKNADRFNAAVERIKGADPEAVKAFLEKDQGSVVSVTPDAVKKTIDITNKIMPLISAAMPLIQQADKEFRKFFTTIKGADVRNDASGVYRQLDKAVRDIQAIADKLTDVTEMVLKMEASARQKGNKSFASMGWTRDNVVSTMAAYQKMYAEVRKDIKDFDSTITGIINADDYTVTTYYNGAPIHTRHYKEQRGQLAKLVKRIFASARAMTMMHNVMEKPFQQIAQRF